MEVTWTDMATQQLANIAEYVADNFGKNTAIKTIDKITKRIDGLLRFPESGTYDKKLSNNKYTMRHITLDPNVVYYLTSDNALIIIAIAHTKQSPNTVRKMIKQSLEQFNK